MGSLQQSARAVAAVSPQVAALSMELQGAGDAIRRLEDGIARLGRSLEPAATSIESARERLGSSREWVSDMPLPSIAVGGVWALAVLFLLLGLALVGVAGALRAVEADPRTRSAAPLAARAEPT